jgi:hypothetical protein
MRFALLPLLVLLFAVGCRHTGKKDSPTPGSTSTNTPPVAVTPDTALIGEVHQVNAGAGIVVLRFPVGRMASAQQRLNVYRGGLKVGEVVATGAPNDDMIAGDIVAGEARAGDVIRSN